MSDILKRSINKLFITVEGVDGVGKSTISKRLAELVSGVSICTPSARFSGRRDLIERGGSSGGKFRFYTECIIEQQEEISGLLEKSSIVCDRYIHSTFAYQWPLDMDLPERIDGYFKEIRVPDFSFLLIADDVVRRRRILDREKSSGIINKADHALDVISTANLRFLRMPGLIHVDTSEKTPDEVCEIMMKFVGSMK